MTTQNRQAIALLIWQLTHQYKFHLIELRFCALLSNENTDHPMSYVTITNASKNYGSVEVLKSISFDVEKGSFVSLVGPSGCGKSTLLRSIAGLSPLSSGEVSIDGKLMNNVSVKNRDIAFVFQSYALYPHMTVRDNLGFSLRMRNVPKEDATRQIEAAASSLGIDTLLDRYPQQLSGGQRQRVAMGRAIVRKPKVFLFDEPLSNLDAELRVRMRSEIRELHDRLGATTIYVTHDQVEAMTMSDKIVVLRDGLIEQEGSPFEIYDNPANTFVAGFIGSPPMNMLPGRILEGGNILLHSGTTLHLQRECRAPVGSEILCGIRPEHMRLADAGLSAEVRLVELQGAETLIVAQQGSTDTVISVRERCILQRGQQICVELDIDKIVLFDAATGNVF